MTKLTTTTGLLLLAATAMAGCNTVNAPIQGRQDPFAPPQVSFASRDLARKTTHDSLQFERDAAGNILYVTLPIRSDNNKTLYVDYKATFFDRNGAVIQETGWLNETLEANTPDQIRFNSTSGRAADVRVALRWAR